MHRRPARTAAAVSHYACFSLTRQRLRLADLESDDAQTFFAEKPLQLRRDVAIGDEEQPLGQIISGDGQRELLLGAIVGGEALLAITGRFAELGEQARDDLAARE